MKKLIVSIGFALAAFGMYNGALGEINTSLNSGLLTINTDVQDTLPGRKKDTTNRKPLPQDTTKKDTLRAMVFRK